MKVFISWSGEISKQIAAEIREWLPLINQQIEPYMSDEDIEKGAHWSAHIRRELEETSFGLVILTPENLGSEWLHFEAGAIAKSVADGRLAPVLFELKQSEVKQPLAMFQATLFDKGEMLRLVRAINASAGDDGRKERQLETVFRTFWPQLEEKIVPKLGMLKQARSTPKKIAEENIDILQEILLLNRQQMRVLANPEDLFGKELLACLTRLVFDHEAVAVRLTADERQLVMALTARWGNLEPRVKRVLQNEPTIQQDVSRFGNYVRELRHVLAGSASPTTVADVFA